MDAKKPKGELGIWKLLGALLVTVVLALGSALIFQVLGWITPLQPKGWWMLGIIVLGLLFKLLFGDLASGEFNYYKHGYDLCVLTMGSAMASVCLQLQSDADLFPGLTAMIPPNLAPTFTANPASISVLLLFLVFMASSFCTLLTARIARTIKEGKSRGNGGLAVINFCCGSAMLGGYVLILVTKG